MGVERIDRETCTGCAKCYQVCPTDVFARLGNFFYLAHAQDCMCCYLCLMECKPHCIDITPLRPRKMPDLF